MNSLSMYASSKIEILVGGGSFSRALCFYTNVSIFLTSSEVNLKRNSGMVKAVDFLKNAGGSGTPSMPNSSSSLYLSLLGGIRDHSSSSYYRFIKYIIDGGNQPTLPLK